MLTDVYIPFGAWWTTPFCKWQGSFATQEPLPFAARIATRAIGERNIDPAVLDQVVLGTTVPSRHSFYGAPWVAGLMGLEGITGPTVSQACATSVRALAMAAGDLQGGASQATLILSADRTSNGPHLYYPNPEGPGGTGRAEDWVMDNFGRDPHAGGAMIATAEAVAAKLEVPREEQEQVTLLRCEQYRQGLADDRAFQRRYMLDAVEVFDARGKVRATVDGDEGVFPTTAEGLAKLRPVTPDGTVTFGTQTHPADGNAGLVLTGREKARELARDKAVEVRVLAFGQARVGKGLMPLANPPACRAALERAGVAVSELKAVTTHVPFAVNDIALSRELGIAPEAMNRFGCSLVWGHPQAPTGLRGVIELAEELAQAGGGKGMFTGCAAGDSAMALVLDVIVE